MRNLRWPLVGLVCVAAMCVAVDDTEAQSSRRSRTGFQPPRRMIDSPTAGTLVRGSFDTELRAFPDGGMLGVLQIGLANAWTVGIAYGGTDIISSNDPQWNPRLQFLTKFQVLGERERLPGIAIGYEDLGFGRWIDSLDRYEVKSKGFYAVGSKSFRGNAFIWALHGGLNLSQEGDDNDEDLNFFFGSDLRLDNNLGFVADYDMGLNDDKEPLCEGEGYGYLNVGVRWVILERIQMEFNLKDLYSNRKSTSSIGRELRLIYVESF